MDVEELKALARAAEPLRAAGRGPHRHERFEVYDHLVSCFHERVTEALGRLTGGQDVQPELTQELRLMARALPGVRRRAEAAVQGEPP